MALETATYISQLVSANPAVGDATGQGDDHLRLLKAVLQTQFPAFTAAALASSNAQLDAAVATVTGTASSVMLAGTVTAPGIAVAGSLTTGLYSPAADQVAVTIHGVQSLLMSSTAYTVPTANITLGAGNLSVGGTITATGPYSGGTGQLVPTGSTHVWWTAALPTGYVWANGASLATASFPALFALFGYTFGGAGANFNVPDMREAAPVGTSTMGGTTSPGRITNYVATTIGGFVGACLHLLTTGELPSHAHSITDPGHTHTFASSAPQGVVVGGGSGVGGGQLVGSAVTSVIASATTGITTTNVNGGAGTHDNVSPSVVCNWIIKT